MARWLKIGYGKLANMEVMINFSPNIGKPGCCRARGSSDSLDGSCGIT